MATLDLRATNVEFNSDIFNAAQGVTIVGGADALLTADGDTSGVWWAAAGDQSTGGVRWQYEGLPPGYSLDPAADSYEVHVVLAYPGSTNVVMGAVVWTRQVGGLGPVDAISTDRPATYTDLPPITYDFDTDPDYVTREVVAAGQVYGLLQIDTIIDAEVRVTQAFLRVQALGSGRHPLRARQRDPGGKYPLSVRGGEPRHPIRARQRRDR